MNEREIRAAIIAEIAKLIKEDGESNSFAKYLK